MRGALSVVEHAVLHPSGEHSAKELSRPVPEQIMTREKNEDDRLHDMMKHAGGAEAYKWILSREQP
jgi:hypothetical protein